MADHLGLVTRGNDWFYLVRNFDLILDVDVDHSTMFVVGSGHPACTVIAKPFYAAASGTGQS
jgi:hypothetical protein